MLTESLSNERGSSWPSVRSWPVDVVESPTAAGFAVGPTAGLTVGITFGLAIARALI